MRWIERLGWALLLIGGVLMLGLQSPFGLPLLWLGAPMVFAGVTARALRGRSAGSDAEG